MEENTTGIVVRVRPYSETSLIAQWITRDLGRVSVLAKGAARPKSPWRGRLDLYFEAEISLARSPRSSLRTLLDLKLGNTRANLRSSIFCLEQAGYFVSAIEHVSEADTPIQELFELLHGMLDLLDQRARPLAPVELLLFEFALLSQSGWAPELHSLPGSPQTKAALSHALQLPARQWAHTEIPKEQLRELYRWIRGCYDQLGLSLPPLREPAFKASRL